MSTIDIRNATGPVTRIRFANDSNHCGHACFVTKTAEGVIFEDRDQDGGNYPIMSEDIGNVRKALDKAEELGWLK